MKSQYEFTEMSFEKLLTQIVLKQNPELFLYTHKLNNGLLEEETFIIKEVNDKSPFFPKAPKGFEFTKPERYANVSLRVVKTDFIAGEYHLEDDSIVSIHNSISINNKRGHSTVSSWINDLTAVQEDYGCK